MAGLIITGIVAGLSSALMFASIVSGSFLGILLFYLTTLPLLIAGIGWGWLTAIIGAVIGGLAVSVASHPLTGLVFFTTVGIPSALLSYLALLSRTDDMSGSAEWYPVGRLVMWSATVGIVVVVGMLLLIGSEMTAYREALTAIISQMPAVSGGEAISEQDVSRIADNMIALLPSASATLWLLMTLFNLYIAGRVVRASGRLNRPWPELAAIEIPGSVNIALALVIGLWFFGGPVSPYAGAAAAVLLMCEALVGLAVIHSVTRQNKTRGPILFALYTSVFILIWPLLFMSVLGILESRFRFRDRFRGPPTPPSLST